MTEIDPNASSVNPVLVDRQDHVMIITINRPEFRNSVNLAVHFGVGDALEEAEKDLTVRAVIITGAGDKAFCAGADLRAFARGEKIMPDEPAKRRWGFGGYVSHHISKPTIAAVNGVALGGGAEIVLASDLAVAADTATLGLPEVKRGLLAGAGGAFRLPAQIPVKFAMEMLLTGDSVPAHRAMDLGLVNAIAPPGQVLDAALRLASRITANAPLSVWASKRIAMGIVAGQIARETAFWTLSQEEGRRLLESEDAREGPRAFAEKRPPNWKAR